MAKASTNDDILEAIAELATMTSDAIGETNSAIGETNSAVRDLAKTTSDKFTELNNKFDGLEYKLNEIQTVQDEHTATLRDHSAQLTSLRVTTDSILGNQQAHERDIAEIYAILERIEAKLEVTDEELKATQVRLQNIVTWAQKVAKNLDIPLKI
jgi:chromosome segregation ATPase